MTSGDGRPVSEREAEVLAAVAEGLSNAQIAGRLQLSVRTVESHVSSLLRKYSAADRRELAALAPRGDDATAPRLLDGVPPALTSFVGRTSELDSVLGLVRGGTRLISLLGPGGAGKSRLAAMAVTVAAASFPFEGAFIDLVPVGDDTVAEVLAATIGVSEQPSTTLIDTICRKLGSQRRLLVLDNCEHVLESISALIGQVLARCPGTTILATSRERLAVPGEHCVTLGPLPQASDAVRLFIDRAAAAGAGAAVADGAEHAAIAAICARLDSLPLTIELAAARAAALGVPGLLAALDDSLRVLAGGRGSDERHRSLRAVLDWSDELLEPAERAMLHRLSVFASAFDLDAAHAVAGDRDLAGTADLLGRLADKSLVVRTTNQWRLLETVRVFAADRLTADGAAPDAAERHLRWAAGSAAGLAQRLSQRSGGRWQADFDAVKWDLHRALAGTAAAPCQHAHVLARSLGRLCFARGFCTEAASHWEQAAGRAPAPNLAAEDLTSAAYLHAFASQHDPRQSELLASAVEQARTAGDPGLLAITTARMVMTRRRQSGTGMTAQARTAYDALLRQAAGAADPDDLMAAAFVAVAQAWNASTSYATPDPDLSVLAVSKARAAGDPALLSVALSALTLAADNAGRYRESLHAYRERLTLLPELPRDDPRSALVIMDTVYRVPRATIAAGSPDDALAAARLARTEDLLHLCPDIPAALPLVAFVLKGELTEALSRAAAVWQAHAADPGTWLSNWLTIDLLAASLACGLRGDMTGYSSWRQRFTDLIAAHESRHGLYESFAAFTAARVALAHPPAQNLPGLVERAFGDFADTEHAAYAHAAGAELAVVGGLPRAACLLDILAEDAKQNYWALAAHLRATGRLHQDTGALHAAADAWQAIGARYEHAVTLTLIPDRAAEGYAELLAVDVPARLESRFAWHYGMVNHAAASRGSRPPASGALASSTDAPAGSGQGSTAE